MDAGELLKLLDLNARPAPPPDEFTPPIPAKSVPPTEAASPTALSLDEWGLRRGRDLIDESERLRKSNTDEFAAADFFGAAFEPDPQLLPECRDARRHQFLKQMLDTPEYYALHADTQLDDTAAGIAAAHFAEQFAQLKKEDAAEPPGGSVPHRERRAAKAATSLARWRHCERLAGRWRKPERRLFSAYSGVPQVILEE